MTIGKTEIEQEKMPIAWIFERDDTYLGFVLEKNIVTRSMIPRENLNEVTTELEQSGCNIRTSDGKIRIIHDKNLIDIENSESHDIFPIQVGKALFKVFLGGDWNSAFKFKYPANLPEFTKLVLEETRKIPKGMVVTYGEIAERIGSPGGARAVGNALGKNPLGLIVPCHRVVKSGGRVGGFMQTEDGSTRSDLKRVILEREGVKFRRGKVLQQTKECTKDLLNFIK